MWVTKSEYRSSPKKTKEMGILPDSFYEASITLILETDIHP